MKGLSTTQYTVRFDSSVVRLNTGLPVRVESVSGGWVLKESLYIRGPRVSHVEH